MPTTKQDAVSGAQREPDERVREALDRAARYQPVDANAVLVLTLAAEVRRLQAAQREPALTLAHIEAICRARWNDTWDDIAKRDGAWDALERAWKNGTPLYTQAQRDEHPPDLEHPRPRETAAESLSVDTSVADRKDAARGRYLIRALHCDDFLNHFGCYTNSIATREKLVDAAMSADVRSQAKDTKRDGNGQRREHDEHKWETR